MQYAKSYRWLWSLTKNLHGSQAKTFVAIAACLVRTQHLRSCNMASVLAQSFEVRFSSGLQRFYRFIKNPKLDEHLLWAAFARQLLFLAGKHPWVSIDWTEWHSNKRVLLASLAVGKRAVPLFSQTFHKSLIPRSQNSRENAFILLLRSFSPLCPKQF